MPHTMTHIPTLSGIPASLVNLQTNTGGALPNQGSGFVLTPFHIVTAAHNLHDIFGNIDVLAGSNIIARAYTPTPSSGGVFPHGTTPFDASISGNISAPLGYSSDSDVSDDIAVIRLPNSVIQPGITPASLMVFADPNDAIGMVTQATVFGYPLDNVTSRYSAHFDTGTIESIFDTGTTSLQQNYVFSLSIDPEAGVSGGPYFFDVDINGDGIADVSGVGGVHSNENVLNGVARAQASIFDLTHYAQIATNILATAPVGFNANMAARHIIIADQDGVASLNGLANVPVANNIINGTFFNEIIYTSNNLFQFQGNDNFDIINAGGGDDTIFASIGADQFNGGAGLDTVDYRSLSGGVTATINATNISVQKSTLGENVDILTSIESIYGTAKADVFTIASLAQGVPIIINGGSLFTPQELPNTKNAIVSEILSPPTSGGRYLSAAQAAAASGVLFNHEDQDTVTIAQALLDAGAAVTYYSAQGEGVIYLNGIEIGYTGIFHEPTQQPEDFFAGIPLGGTVGFDPVGETVLDLSGVTEPITNALLSGISATHLGLVDDLVTGAANVVLDLGALGLDTFTGGDGVDDIIGGVRVVVNDNFSCALRAA